MTPLPATPPAPRPTLRSARFRYGFLTILLVLLAVTFWLTTQLPSSYQGHRYFSLVVPVMILLQHLAFQFRWSPRTERILRVISHTATVIGCSYIFYMLFTTDA